MTALDEMAEGGRDARDRRHAEQHERLSGYCPRWPKLQPSKENLAYDAYLDPAAGPGCLSREEIAEVDAINREEDR